MSYILIKDGNILDFSSKETNGIKNADILIKDNLIYKISDKPIEVDKNTKIINAKNKLIFPGLINSHSHIPMTLMRGFADDLPLKSWLNNKIFPAESKIDPTAVFFGTILGITELIRSGCTTIVDMYFFMEDVVKALDITGFRGLLSLGILDNNEKESLIKSEDFYNKYNNSLEGRIKVYLGPHAPYTCNPKFLKKVTRLAKELNTGVHIHLNETRKEIKEYKIKYNQNPIVEIEKTGIFETKTIAAHCTYLNKDEIDILKKNDVLVVHNPSSNMKLASGIASIQKLFDENIKLAIGTDGAASNNSLNLWHEMRLSALLSKIKTKNASSLPPNIVLRMASSMPGNYFWNGLIGDIQENKYADIIIIDMNKPNLKPCISVESNLVNAMYGNEVNTVIINGKIIMENNKIIVFDEKEMIKEALNQSERITGKKSFFAI
jgi:5-methylthioadenosine/S-adenosylhomocysteine deaminase